jgi:hypothetical protein
MDVATLQGLLREAEEHHGPFEAASPKHHWSGFYAAYVVAREEGRSEDEAASAGAQYIERELAAQGASS